MWINRRDFESLKQKINQLNRRVKRLELICFREAEKRMDSLNRGSGRINLSKDMRLKNLEDIYLSEARDRLASLKDKEAGNEFLPIEIIADKTIDFDS